MKFIILQSNTMTNTVHSVSLAVSVVLTYYRSLCYYLHTNRSVLIEYAIMTITIAHINKLGSSVCLSVHLRKYVIRINISRTGPNIDLHVHVCLSHRFIHRPSHKQITSNIIYGKKVNKIKKEKFKKCQETRTHQLNIDRYTFCS